MSGRKGKGPKLELKLNLSPPGGNAHVDTATRAASVSPTSPPSSCISSEFNQDNYLSSPEATSMMLVGCPRCLMYVMLADEDACCPKCKSNVLLDVAHQNSTLTSKKASKN